MESIDPPQLPLTGGCGCGAVRFEVTEPLVEALYCHCTRCQRRTGTAASASARPAPGSFRIVKGESELRAWRPEGGFEKCFCGECGSAVSAAIQRITTPSSSVWAVSIQIRRSAPASVSCGLRGILGADPR